MNQEEDIKAEQAAIAHKHLINEIKRNEIIINQN